MLYLQLSESGACRVHDLHGNRS